ncbi:MAG: DUF2621 family protein [Myxococcota bacterium]
MEDSPFFGFSHVDVPVTDLERALALYRDGTGFPEKQRGEGWVDIDGAASLLRLVQTKHPENRVTLRLHALDVERACRRLVECGAELLYEAMKTPDRDLMAAVRDPDGNTIYVWRPLTEDEYDQAVAIPKTKAWSDEAEALLQALLKHVPAMFRDLSRPKVATEAERLAEAEVGREEVIRGFILASPKITRERNRGPLVAEGIDVTQYQDEWEAE